jgi:hypothetical protein
MKSAISLLLVIHFFAATLVAQDQQTRSVPTADQKVKSWLTQQDKNNDGRISEAESSGLMKRFFARNNLNRDGILDRGELTKLAQRLARNTSRTNTQQQRMTNEQTRWPGRDQSSRGMHLRHRHHRHFEKEGQGRTRAAFFSRVLRLSGSHGCVQGRHSSSRPQASAQRSDQGHRSANHASSETGQGCSQAIAHHGHRIYPACTCTSRMGNDFFLQRDQESGKRRQPHQW